MQSRPPLWPGLVQACCGVQHDVVARASLKALEALRDEVAGIHWERRLRDKVILSLIAGSTCQMGAHASCTLPACTLRLAGRALYCPPAALHPAAQVPGACKSHPTWACVLLQALVIAACMPERQQGASAGPAQATTDAHHAHMQIIVPRPGFVPTHPSDARRAFAAVRTLLKGPDACAIYPTPHCGCCTGLCRAGSACAGLDASPTQTSAAQVTAHRLGRLAEETGSSISSQYQRVSQAVQAAVQSAQLQQHTASVQRLWDQLSDSTSKHACAPPSLITPMLTLGPEIPAEIRQAMRRGPAAVWQLKRACCRAFGRSNLVLVDVTATVVVSPTTAQPLSMVHTSIGAVSM